LQRTETRCQSLSKSRLLRESTLIGILVSKHESTEYIVRGAERALAVASRPGGGGRNKDGQPPGPWACVHPAAAPAPRRLRAGSCEADPPIIAVGATPSGAAWPAAWANKSVQAARVCRAARSALQPSCVRSRRTCGQGGGRGRTGCGRSNRASGGGAPCVGGLFVPATGGGRATGVTPANPRRRAATRRRRPLLPPSVARSGCVRRRLRAAATLRGGGCGWRCL